MCVCVRACVCVCVCADTCLARIHLVETANCCMTAGVTSLEPNACQVYLAIEITTRLDAPIVA